ncbi:MAG TPA: 2'-5' RNA ligase family protein [candidate division Zixibacteria bacterium]|nr:2'-5' RNA ligase family protein [candidate division Zixibacteria bacterium]
MFNHFNERRHHKFALVIFLPTELEGMIAHLREKYDPLYNLVNPHITVVFPFESQRTLEELVAALGSELTLETRFHLDLDSIGDFYPTAPVIYWEVKTSERLSQLYYRLYSRLGLAVPFSDYRPHVTVAREISHHRIMFVKDKIVDYLPTESFEVKTIDLITALPESKWVSVRTFTLLGNGSE